MLGLRNILKSIVLVVIFVALAALATYFYNSDEARQVEIKNNPLLLKGKEVLSAVFNVSSEIVDVNAEKNLGFGHKMVEKANDVLENTDWQGLINGTKPIKESFSKKMTDYSEEENIEIDETIDDLRRMVNEEREEADSARLEKSENRKKSGFFSKIITKFKEEWTEIKTEEGTENFDFNIEDSLTIF